MALLALRLGHSGLLPAPPLRRHRQRQQRQRLLVSCSAVSDGGAAVVWFKHDLRLDDHPGLVAACAEPRRRVVPLYVFDSRILAGYSDTRLELLLFALKDLKLALKSQRSDLLIGLGNAEDAVLKIANEVQAGVIYTEEEVEQCVCSVLANVESSLSNGSFTRGNPPEIKFWSAPLYDYKSLRQLSTSRNQFLNEKFSTTTALPAPTLPTLNVELDTGSLPTLEELKVFLKESRMAQDNWVPIKSTSARSILKAALIQRKIKSNVSLSDGDGENIEDITTSAGAPGRKIAGSMFASESSLEVRGGTDITLDALDAYLKYLEGTGKASWQELHDKVRFAETRDGASFRTLFGNAIQLGVISRRRAYQETIQYERDRNAGFLSPFGYSTPTVTSAVDAICSLEWYWLLALKSQVSIEGNYPLKFWRWKGYLIQYTSVGHEGPAVLLVHGFGASLQHFRDNISNIADEGHRVWAITLLGFGKSEKPNVDYSELLWSELLRDFIVDVVREPVHLVGNSIGGYICAIAAGLWPSLANSLVLLNSAGSVVPNYSFIPLSKEGRTSWLSRLQARLLLLFLRSRVGGILKGYYPTRTERVDKPLVDEIIRAVSSDHTVYVLQT
uniref:Photolyase/cryptochrome alpha/beta domain-containing protein n=2 Tax=Aegilops tauschii subsp. strangulata TaxID=200361 RepID=A0A453LEV2_AEGTS